MSYRVCRVFHIESGHMLSRHPGRCRFPHGHSRRVEVVVAADELDENGMVCDFQALKLALAGCLDRLDHAMAVNSADPMLGQLRESGARVVVFEGVDPTTEVLARYVHDELAARIAGGEAVKGPDGAEYRLRPGLRIERVRVGETASSWAEYAP
jgi:6-pyruvoyltetrahydropterin/6-carboxytetrahydropterin synthase